MKNFCLWIMWDVSTMMTDGSSFLDRMERLDRDVSTFLK